MTAQIIDLNDHRQPSRRIYGTLDFVPARVSTDQIYQIYVIFKRQQPAKPDRPRLVTFQAILTLLDDRTGVFRGTDADIAEWVNLTDNQVRTAVSTLVAEGWITRISDGVMTLLRPSWEALDALPAPPPARAAKRPNRQRKKQPAPPRRRVAV